MRVRQTLFVCCFVGWGLIAHGYGSLQKKLCGFGEFARSPANFGLILDDFELYLLGQI